VGGGAGRVTATRSWSWSIVIGASSRCTDVLGSRSRRLLPPSVTTAADPLAAPPPAGEVGWLEPYPDRFLDEIVDAAAGPHE